MHHRLFVPALVILQPIPHLIECLRHARNVSVPEDSKHSAEQLLPRPVAFGVLNGEETDERLCHGQPFR
jgi:hypothetical protein